MRSKSPLDNITDTREFKAGFAFGRLARAIYDASPHARRKLYEALLLHADTLETLFNELREIIEDADDDDDDPPPSAPAPAAAPPQPKPPFTLNDAATYLAQINETNRRIQDDIDRRSLLSRLTNERHSALRAIGINPLPL